MAEGFVRKYGSDVVHAESAGIGPAAAVDALTIKVMGEKNEEAFSETANAIEHMVMRVILELRTGKRPAPRPVSRISES
jgi:hypothetical protein